MLVRCSLRQRTVDKRVVFFTNARFASQILRITDDVLEQLVQEDGEPLVNSVAQVYTAACPQINLAYHRYCSGLKMADSLLVNKTRNPEFMRMLNDPPVPRRRPDLTAFLHKPLEVRKTESSFSFIKVFIAGGI